MWMPRCTRSSALPGAVAAHQLHLQVVQRVDVRESGGLMERARAALLPGGSFRR
jgi:hypothetical protein